MKKFLKTNMPYEQQVAERHCAYDEILKATQSFFPLMTYANFRRVLSKIEIKNDHKMP